MVTENCSQTHKIRTVKREEGGVEDSGDAGTGGAAIRDDVRGRCQTLVWAGEGNVKQTNTLK